MKGRIRSTVAVLAVATGLAQPLAASPRDPELEAGIRLFKEGDLQAAVISLDGVAGKLRADELRRSELVEALVYKGAALVGLAQEEPAKTAFSEALSLEPDRKLSETEFSRRVVRVFEAAREGKSKSVLLPPAGGTAKKAGIGALGVGAIVGGAVLIGGGAAVAAAGGGGDSTPAPTPVVDPSTYSVTLSSDRNCGAGGFTLSQSASLTLSVAIAPPSRCLFGFCLGAVGSIYGTNCLNPQQTNVTSGYSVTIPGVSAGMHPLWFCDCESEPSKRTPMTVTVSATAN
jgi:hypothetical protein